MSVRLSPELHIHLLHIFLNITYGCGFILLWQRQHSDMLRTSGLTDNIIFCTKWPEIGNAIKVYTQTGTTG